MLCLKQVKKSSMIFPSEGEVCIRRDLFGYLRKIFVFEGYISKIIY